MQKVTLSSEEIDDISGGLILWDEDGLGKASLEDMLNISPETSLALDEECAVEFFKILDDNMHKISISENMAKKILTMKVGPTVKFQYWIYCKLYALADRLVEYEDDSSDDSDDEDDTQKAKEESQKQLQDIESIINCVLKIVKGYDELEKRFIRALATFVNRKLDKTKYDMSNWYDKASYRGALPRNKFIVTFILKTLRKNNMTKWIQLFIDTLKEDIKVKMKTAFDAIAPNMKVVNDKLSLNANKKSENKKIDAFEDRSNVKHDGTVKFNNKFKNNMNNNLNNINNDNINSNQSLNNQSLNKVFEDSRNIRYSGDAESNSNLNNNLNNINNDNINNNRSLNKEIMITRDQNQFSNNDIKRNAGSNLALDRTKNINNNLNQPEKPQQISICESSMRGPKQNLKISHVVSETIISKNPVDLCKTLKAAYIYSDMATIDNLIKDGDLFSAMRTSGCFCYYAWMIPSEKYETVKHNFTKWERFKIYLYFIVWLFVKPEKANVKIKPDVSAKSQGVVKNAEQIIKQNYLKSEMRENPFEK